MPVTYNRSNKAAKAATRYMEGRGGRERDARARRDDLQKQNIDAALRQPLQETPSPAVTPAPTTTMPIATAAQAAGATAAPPAVSPRRDTVGQRQVSNLANVPGGGGLATQMQGAQRKASMKQEEEIWTLLQLGEKDNRPEYIEQAKHLNQVSGAGIPDYFFDDPYIRSQLTQIIGEARNISKNPRQIAAFIQGSLSKNPELMTAIAQRTTTGRGIPEGIQAGAGEAERQAKQKSKDTRSRRASGYNRYPEERMRIEISKRFGGMKNGWGELVYSDGIELMEAVDREMVSLGYPSRNTNLRQQKYDNKTGHISDR